MILLKFGILAKHFGRVLHNKLKISKSRQSIVSEKLHALRLVKHLVEILSEQVFIFRFLKSWKQDSSSFAAVKTFMSGVVLFNKNGITSPELLGNLCAKELV